MNKFLKDFTIEDWVNGTNTESFIRIQVLDEEEQQSRDVQSYTEAVIRLRKIEKQYYEVLERNKSLEEQLYNAQCQVRTLQVSDVYNNREFIDENIVQTEIEKITQQIIENNSNSEDKDSLQSQIYFQRLIIDDLMCKLQNMHHRVEYYKEDVTELKYQFEKEKTTLEQEKRNNDVANELYQEATRTIQDLNSQIDDLTDKLQYALSHKEIETKIVVEKTSYQVDVENEILESRLYQDVYQIKKKFNEQLVRVQRKNQMSLENLGLCMKKRTDELKHFYEYRIRKMIEEFSFEEAKFQSKKLELREEISENLKVIRELETRFNLSERKFLLDRQRSNKAEAVIKSLEEIVDKLNIDMVESSAKSKAEIESMKKHTSYVENDLKSSFSQQARLAEKKYEDAVESMKQEYKAKVEKINDEFKLNMKKLSMKEKKEHLTLLDEISRIERDKTEIEMQVEERVQDVLREAKAKYQEYEFMLDHNKRQLLEQWNNDRREMRMEHENEMVQLQRDFREKMHEQTAKIHDEYETKIELIEQANMEKIRNVNRKHVEEVIAIKDANSKAVTELNSSIEKLNIENFNYCRVIKGFHAEKEEMKEKYEELLKEQQIRYNDLTSSYNELRNLKARMQSAFEEKIAILSQQLADKERVLRLKYETEKNVAINIIKQEKADMEAMASRKIIELSRRYEELTDKYNKKKQKKSILRISDNGSSRITQELVEKERAIELLKKEKHNLQTALDYMNSTVRIFSSQEQVFHTKTNSTDLRTPKGPRKQARFTSSNR